MTIIMAFRLAIVLHIASGGSTQSCQSFILQRYVNNLSLYLRKLSGVCESFVFVFPLPTSLDKGPQYSSGVFMTRG